MTKRMRNNLFLHIITGVTEILVPAVHHPFNSCGEGIQA
jgi:hypothetical protein